MSPAGAGRGRSTGGPERRRAGAAGASGAGSSRSSSSGAGSSRSGSSGRSGRASDSSSRAGSGRTGSGRTGSGRTGSGRSEASRTSSGRTGAGEHVEGRQAVRELLRAGRRRVRQLYVAEGADPTGPLGEIVDLAGAAGVPVRWIPRDRIDALAATDAPQGVIAAADALPEPTLDEVVKGSGAGVAPFLVVLDGVTDPHNLGAVMRSALCAGATGLVVARHRAASLSPAAVKAAAGAVEYLPVVRVAGVPAALGELSAAGVWTVGLDADAAADIWHLPVASEPVALVLGAEGRGLSPLARRRCDLIAAVPMSGPLDSLNVSAAAALACFEVARRRSGR